MTANMRRLLTAQMFGEHASFPGRSLIFAEAENPDENPWQGESSWRWSPTETGKAAQIRYACLHHCLRQGSVSSNGLSPC
jgi:hypothetical protein